MKAKLREFSKDPAIYNRSLIGRLERNSMPEPNTGCWFWIKSLTIDGYGRMGYMGSLMLSHRASYLAHKGDIPKGYCVCHKCDNPSCINPEHLFLGTHEQNMNDRNSKKRDPRGIMFSHTKFTESDIRKIRTVYKQGGLSMAKIGKQFNTDSSQIYRIVRGKTWGHII